LSLLSDLKLNDLDHKKVFIVGTILLLFLIAFCSYDTGSRVRTAITESIHPKKSLNIPKSIVEDDLIGKIIIVNFPDYKNMEYLAHSGKIYNAQKSHESSVFLVDCIQYKKGEVVNYAEKHNIENMILSGKLSKLKRRFGVSQDTKVAVFNPKGKLEREFETYGEMSDFDNVIAEIIFDHAKDIKDSVIFTKTKKIRKRNTILNFPTNISYVHKYKKLYGKKPFIIISDSGNDRLIISSISGKVFDYVGSGSKGDSDGSLSEANFNSPQGTLFKDGILYVADASNSKIKAVDLVNDEVYTILSSNNGILYPTKIVNFEDEDDIILILNSGKGNILSYNIKTDETMEVSSRKIDDIEEFDGKIYYIDAKHKRLQILGEEIEFDKDESGQLVSEESECDEDAGVCKNVGGEIGISYETMDEILVDKLGDAYLDEKKKKEKKKKKKKHDDVVSGNIGMKISGLPKDLNGLYIDDIGVYVASNNAIHSIYEGEAQTYSGNKLKGIGDRGKIVYKNPSDLIGVKDRFYVVDTDNHRIIILNRNSEDVSVLNIRLKNSLKKF
jgi:hypothetical protein